MLRLATNLQCSAVSPQCMQMQHFLGDTLAESERSDEPVPTDVAHVLAGRNDCVCFQRHARCDFCPTSSETRIASASLRWWSGLQISNDALPGSRVQNAIRCLP